jgi:quercetin dioxygenase-like cupin family protein
MTDLASLPPEEQPEGVELRMADGIFIKEMRIAKAGTLIPQHSHRYDHTSMVARGAVRVWQGEDELGEFKAPCGLFIKGGEKHLFLALEDETIVYCIHNLAHSGTVEILEEHDLGELDLPGGL